MKKFLSLLVAAVLITTLVMPVTASAFVTARANLYVTDGVKVESIPSGWEKVGDTDNGVLYQTTDDKPGSNYASTYFGQWTAANFSIPSDEVFLGFTDDLTGLTLTECQTTSTKFNVITQLDVTAPAIEEGEDPSDYTLSFTSTPKDAIGKCTPAWFKVPAGDDLAEKGTALEEGETFDKAYDYYLKLKFEVSEGYMFTDTTTFLVNGTKLEFEHNKGSLLRCFKVDFKSDEPTTDAPTQASTQAPTTTAAATSPQTGDAASPLFYILAIIALAGAASVTIFARRKK